jgi:hypothetical protein
MRCLAEKQMAKLSMYIKFTSINSDVFSVSIVVLTLFLAIAIMSPAIAGMVLLTYTRWLLLLEPRTLEWNHSAARQVRSRPSSANSY